MKNSIIDYIKKALLGFVDSRSSEKFCVAIVLLRVLATCLITNTHYNNVYPSERFAIGGLLGDVIFFAVSGYCFAGGIKHSFSQWYTKRWTRIYPSILIMSVVFLLIGYWRVENMNLTNFCAYFILPSNFLFFGAIMICYVPMYFTVNVKSEKDYKMVVAAWLILYAAYYIFCIDKTEYSMNAVSNPIILLLYFGAILTGVSAKRNQTKMRDGKKVYSAVKFLLVFVFAALYFVATVVVRGNESLYAVQFVVPIFLLGMCYFLTSAMVGVEETLKKMPAGWLNFFGFIANLTLEIYVVQLPIIKLLEGIVFPLNWIIITASIVIAASVLKLITYGITKKADLYLIGNSK